MEMKTRLPFLLPLSIALVVLLAACGGGGDSGSGGSVPPGSVAQVGSTPITRTTFNTLMAIGLAGFKARGQKPPKVGTPTYTQLKDQAVTFLVQENELQQEAQKLGVSVTQKDIDNQIDELTKTRFQGSKQKLDAALKQNQITLDQFEQYDVRPSLLSQKLQAKVTSDVKVSDAAAQKYYNENKASFGAPAETTRSVRHILVKNKKLADQLEQKLNSGASFASLARKYSKDPGTAAQGGKYAAVKGKEVPAYDAVAFTLKTGKTSAPVNATSKANGSFGWFIIQPLGPVKKTAAKTQPFSQVKAEIQENLAGQQKQVAWQNWLQKLAKDFKGKVSYQTGYAPVTTTTPTVPAQTTPATTNG
jgi:foldase protein PrsA